MDSCCSRPFTHFVALHPTRKAPPAAPTITEPSSVIGCVRRAVYAIFVSNGLLPTADQGWVLGSSLGLPSRHTPAWLTPTRPGPRRLPAISRPLLETATAFPPPSRHDRAATLAHGEAAFKCKAMPIFASSRLTRAPELFYRRRTVFDHVECRSQAMWPGDTPRNGLRLLCLGPRGG